MIDLECSEFANIDGIEYLLPTRGIAYGEDWHMMNIPAGYELCEHCFGDGQCECNDGWEGKPEYGCCDCGDSGYFPDLDLAGWCVADGCFTATVNKSHGEWLCTEHDESRHIEVKNYPGRYERKLL